MNVALINGSPKVNRGATSILLSYVKGALGEDVQVHELTPRDDMQVLAQCEAWILAYPLYVDGIPGHLLEPMQGWAAHAKGRNVAVYGIANCGFYEGKQCALSLQMLRLWCASCGATWGRGLGVGAGGMLHAVRDVPQGQGPLGAATKACAQIAQEARDGQTGGEDLFPRCTLPRALYKTAAQGGFRAQGKANGLTTRDLGQHRTSRLAAGARLFVRSQRQKYSR